MKMFSVFEGNIVGDFANDSNEKRHVIINKFIRRPMLYAEILHKETNGRLTGIDRLLINPLVS